MNPYLNRMMIREPEDFVGRKATTAAIMDRLGSERIVSIEGDRRIGKSSLLFQMALTGQPRAGAGPGRYFSYIDLQQFRDSLTPELFREQLAEALARCAGGEEVSAGAQDRVEAAGELLRKMSRQAVLLLDEFDLVALRPDFDAYFYTSLQSLCERFPVTMVVTTRFPLSALAQAGGLAGFSLGEHFDCVPLGPLEEQEARELIGISAVRTGLSLEPYADWLIETAGLRPFYLQMACAAAFDVLSENPQQDLNVDEVERRFLQEALPHCRYQVSMLWPAEQQVLTEIARGSPPAHIHSEMRSRLILDGYLVERHPGVEISSRMLRVFLTRRRELEGDAAASERRKPLSSGLSLADHLIKEIVKSDAMGYLCHSEDRRSGRQAALRVIDSSALEGMLRTELLVDQARQVGSLSHPAIAAPYEVTSVDGLVLMAVPWLHGESLRKLIGPGGHAEWRQFVRWVAAACGGLAAAHREGVIHRNLKPANLFIENTGEVRVLDFGVPRHYQLMRSLSLGGTLSNLRPAAVQYLSPEQACAEPADHRSDLFSLGVVLYEGLTGVSPFLRTSVSETLRAILNDDVPLLGLEDERISREINEIVMKLLDKRPLRRYPNARTLAADLQKLVKSRRHPLFWFRS